MDTRIPLLKSLTLIASQNDRMSLFLQRVYVGRPLSAQNFDR
jgi:hypothetical protein